MIEPINNQAELWILFFISLIVFMSGIIFLCWMCFKNVNKRKNKIKRKVLKQGENYTLYEFEGSPYHYEVHKRFPFNIYHYMVYGNLNKNKTLKEFNKLESEKNE